MKEPTYQTSEQAWLLGPGEPAMERWQIVTLAEFVRLIVTIGGSPLGRPPIVALDGRSSSGKTTLARRITGVVPKSYTVHTDDIAWNHARFDWADLLIEGVLAPLRLGKSITFRPPAWDQHHRAGSIDVLQPADLVIVEGVGAGRREVEDLVDVSVWVQIGLDEIGRRNEMRVTAGEINESGVEGWMAEEMPFIEHQRPWERASLLVSGAAVLPHDPSAEVIVAWPWPAKPG